MIHRKKFTESVLCRRCPPPFMLCQASRRVGTLPKPISGVGFYSLLDSVGAYEPVPQTAPAWQSLGARNGGRCSWRSERKKVIETVCREPLGRFLVDFNPGSRPGFRGDRTDGVRPARESVDRLLASCARRAFFAGRSCG